MPVNNQLRVVASLFESTNMPESRLRTQPNGDQVIRMRDQQKKSDVKATVGPAFKIDLANSTNNTPNKPLNSK